MRAFRPFNTLGPLHTFLLKILPVLTIVFQILAIRTNVSRPFRDAPLISRSADRVSLRRGEIAKPLESITKTLLLVRR